MAEPDDTRGRLLAAAEALLQEVSLDDLSVARIIQAAGVSRASFYRYFRTKNDVVTGLLQSIMDDLYEVSRPVFDRTGDASPYEAAQEGLAANAAVWHRHRLVLRAVSENWGTIAELRELWPAIMRRFAQGSATEIDRVRGTPAPVGAPASAALASTLLWAAERIYHVAGLETELPLGDEQEVSEALLAIWDGALRYAPGE